MQLIINGEATETQAANIAALVAELGHEGYVAVAINEEIVSRRDWLTTVLSDGDELEIITPRQGG